MNRSASHWALHWALLAVLAAMAGCANAGGPPEVSVAPVAEPAEEWRSVDGETGTISDLAGLSQLAEDFPDSASVQLRLLNAQMQAEDTAAALVTASGLTKRGYVFSDGANNLLTSWGPDAEQAASLAMQSDNRMAVGASQVTATVPVEAQLVETVWRHPGTGAFVVTSVVSKALFAREQGGAWRKIELAGAGSLSGMAYDQNAGILWIGSTVLDQTPEPEGSFRGLIGVDPATLTETHRIAAPDGASVNDLTVDASGTVFAADSISGAIYSAKPDASDMQTLVAPGTFRSPQGLVRWPGSDDLFVSDYRYGLAVVDLESGEAVRVRSEITEWIDGIDGLWRVGDHLVAVQNGATPMRIIEFGLSPDRRTIARAIIRERANPDWTEPVGGSVHGGTLLYVATGQWDRFGDGGIVTEGKTPAPTQIRSISAGHSAPVSAE